MAEESVEISPVGKEKVYGGKDLIFYELFNGSEKL